MEAKSPKGFIRDLRNSEVREVPKKSCDGPGKPTGKDVMVIKGVRGKTGKSNSIDIDRERHQSHLELGSIRMVLIFDYILQAHSGGGRAISSLKRPNH